MFLLPDLIEQSVYIVDSFPLECGVILQNVPVAYKTWGSLNKMRDNVMIICHAFTGSADVEDWWGPLMGHGKAFDPRHYFIFCANVLGSPYGTASPITTNPETGRPYGPEFPPTTIRDDVRLHKVVLDHLNVWSVAVAIGGSMGGMAVLEWPLCSPPGYVRHIIPLATSARHSAWCISWGEAQRQSIFSDPGYKQGYYEEQPVLGLAAARMSALLTYRSRDSFENRFGRNPQVGPARGTDKVRENGKEESIFCGTSGSRHFALHNDGHRNVKMSFPGSDSDSPTVLGGAQTRPTDQPAIFTAQSYLRYQGEKFVARFDANCYIHITRKLDSHDITRGRGVGWHSAPQSLSATPDAPFASDRFQNTSPDATASPSSDSLAYVLSIIPPHALIISIESDGLFTTSEQRQLAEHIPNAELKVIPSLDGHDGFLLEFEAINGCVLDFLKKAFPEYYSGVDGDEETRSTKFEGFGVKKSSVFGEAEVDVTMW